MQPQFDFTDEEIFGIERGRLLSLEIEFTRACNYRCPYCYAADVKPNPAEELRQEEIGDVITQAHELGARKIVILGGEPLLYPQLPEILKFIRSLDMGPEIFTNGSLITRETAKILFENRARVIVKYNTPDPAEHDRLTGVHDSLKKTRTAIRQLKEAGYSGLENMLGATTVLTASNIEQAPLMWKELREQKLVPYFECLTPQGRLLENRHLMPEPEQLRHFFEWAAEYDRSPGKIWEPQPPLVGGKCFRHRYSCLVKSNGEVNPCVGIAESMGNIRETPLADILRESIILQKLYDWEKWIKEPCRSCDKIKHCYGCRGAAWQYTGSDYLAADPTCWRNAEKLNQIKVLPVSTENLIPHRSPEAISGMIEHITNRGGIFHTVIPSDSIFLNSDKEFSSEALCELASQAFAAFDSFTRDGKVLQGMLAGINRFHAYEPVHAGEKVLLRFETVTDFMPWHILAFELKKEDGSLIAEGEVKLCAPEN